MSRTTHRGLGCARRIAVVLELMPGHCRRILHGIRRYAHLHSRNWRLLTLDAIGLEPLGEGEAWRCDGIIAGIPNDEALRTYRRRRVPFVNISSATAVADAPSVLFDNRAIGRLGGEHLVSLGLRHFAFFGDARHGHAQGRLLGFLDVLHRRGLRCDVIHPPLSSIDISPELLGERAAGLLDRIMRGQSAPRRALRIAPTGVVARQSTDLLAVDDPDIAAAVHFIRAAARSRPLRVSEVCRQVATSRRTFIALFRRANARCCAWARKRPPARPLQRRRSSSTRRQIPMIAGRRFFRPAPRPRAPALHRTRCFPHDRRCVLSSSPDNKPAPCPRRPSIAASPLPRCSFSA
jgi:AraC-like DNA-binding protein